jgi:hypothetical protein
MHTRANEQIEDKSKQATCCDTFTQAGEAKDEMKQAFTTQESIKRHARAA